MFDFNAAIASVQAATEAGGESMPRLTIEEANSEVRAMVALSTAERINANDHTLRHGLRWG